MAIFPWHSLESQALKVYYGMEEPDCKTPFSIYFVFSAFPEES